MKNHVDLRISSVVDVEYHVRHVESIDPSKVDYKIKSGRLIINPKSKVLGFETEIVCTHQEEKDRPVLMRYVNRMSFYIDNFQEVVTQGTEGKPTIDKGLARFLLDMAIPTIRGILIEKTAGTGLEKCYLPLITANQLIP